MAIQNFNGRVEAKANSDKLADLHEAGQELGKISDITQLEQATT